MRLAPIRPDIPERLRVPEMRLSAAPNPALADVRAASLQRRPSFASTIAKPGWNKGQREQQNTPPDRPDNWRIPGFPGIGTVDRVNPLIFENAVADIARLAVFQPAMAQRVALGVEAKHPRRIVVQDAIHLAHDAQAFQRVIHILHPGKQTIEGRTGIVRSVLPATRHLALIPVEQEEEILRSG